MKRRAKKKSPPVHDRQQVPTTPTTVFAIMSRPTFALGVEDARASRGYRRDYDTWEDTNDRWTYERGRQWARVAPRTVPLKVNGKVTQQAMQWYRPEVAGGATCHQTDRKRVAAPNGQHSFLWQQNWRAVITQLPSRWVTTRPLLI